MTGGGNIKVVVRCRPLNSRELARGAKGLIRMEGSQTILDPPEQQTGGRSIEKKPMVFSFDRSYWSAGPRDEPQYASQQTLYDDLGEELLDHSFEGFNTCIFAYGQTGSGKSYSMMGYKGIIPLTTSELFNRVASRTAADPNLSYTIEVSYIEIYNEKVRDLLNPKNKSNLRVREHPSLGPYVEDLSKLVVQDYGQMMSMMDDGNKARTVASTNMNETSSRSHAVFTVILTQKRLDAKTKMVGEKVSKISLVDLAGSERQASTGATGTRLKEGANINKSLTTLGKVIAALAQASSDTKRKRKDDFVPYRDSVLTWLLKESLGGNSKTAMIAAISPADYEETLSTLRYADAAKKIVTRAVVNEDANAKLIRELKEELVMLRGRVSDGDSAPYDPSVPPEKQMVTLQGKDGQVRKVSKLELQDQLEQSERLMDSLNQSWEEKVEQTKAIQVEREKALEEMGITIHKDLVGVHAPQNHPSLVNLNEDPLMSECLIYQLKPGTTVAGSPEETTAHIKLSGSNIQARHCTFDNQHGVVTLEATEDARTFVNGKRVQPSTPVQLFNGYRVILGDFHVFRFNDPAAVRKQRQKLASSASMGDMTPITRSDTPLRGDEMDWTAARREMADIEKLGDQDLDQLFDNIMQVRSQRQKPESRIDISADVESRFLTPSADGDPNVNPWADPNDPTMTGTSIRTPHNIDGDRDNQVVDYGKTLLPAFVDGKIEDADLEKQHLTRQLRNMAQEMKRVRAQAAKDRALERPIEEQADWSAKELKLVQWAVERWKRLRVFKVAERILTQAVLLREANVMVRQLEKNVEYNFLVASSHVMNTSSLDDLNGVEFEDVSGAGADDGSQVLVKVIDRSAAAVYCWPFDRFSSQVTKMRQVHTHHGKPGYADHFQQDEPFSDIPAPVFSFIGTAKLPLRLLASQLPTTATVPIVCPYTMEALGSCRIDLHASAYASAYASSSGMQTPESMSRKLADPLVPGQKLTISLTVDNVRGMSSDDFASVHAQLRLTSLLGPHIASEDTYASLPIDLDQATLSQLSLRRTLTVVTTAEMIKWVAEEAATLDFFAKVRPAYLDRLTRWDKKREPTGSGSAQDTPGKRPDARRNETDFVAPEQHDMLADVRVLELGNDGEYVPADVVDEVLQLHQGLQRRLQIRLSHTSGKGLPWTKLAHVSVGGVRVSVKGTEEIVSPEQVELKAVSEVEYGTDGSATLTATAGWDTTAHNAVQMNRRTPPDQAITVKLLFLLAVDSLDELAVFELDISVKILDRDARRSSFKFWSSAKLFSSMTATYSLNLTAPMAQSADELWRLDTAQKHVPGQEVLADWKPRSLTLIEDYEKSKKIQRMAGDVQLTRAVLGLHGDVEGQAKDEDEVARRCVEMWVREMNERVVVDVKRATPDQIEATRKLRKMIADLEPALVPSVKRLYVSESVIRAGPLMLLTDSAKNEWQKLHFVLRRPFLLIHAAAGQRETRIIGLARAHVVPSPAVEQLLGRKYAFTIFTPTNSFILQAPNAKDLNDWVSAIAATSEI